MSSRVHKIKAHPNGSAEKFAGLAVANARVVPEAIVVTGPVQPGAPGERCDLTEECTALTTHHVPVAVDGRPGQVFGCLQHAILWAEAEPEDGD